MDTDDLTPIKALNAALAAAQGEFPTIPREKEVTVKTRDRGSYSFRYAELSTIFAAVRPVLAKHGLAVCQRLENNGRPSIRTELRHADGGVIGDSFPLLGEPSTPQQLGSLITYQRRYAIVSLLGIATEEDDDAHQAAESPKPERSSLSTQQRKKVYALKEKLINAEAFNQFEFDSTLVKLYGTPRIADLNRDDASDLIKRLEEKETQIWDESAGTADPPPEDVEWEGEAPE